MGYQVDITINAKILTRTLRGLLPLASATALTKTTVSRAWKPLPPGNVRLNGLNYASWPTNTSGDVTLSWSHRSRANHGPDKLLASQDDTGTEVLEGTIKVEVLINGISKRTWTGLTGTSQIYTWAQRQTDDADTTKSVAFRITPINGSFTGTVRVTPSFVMGA